MIEGKTILLISPGYWDDFRVSKHHYAIELSKHNNVFYLDQKFYQNRKPFLRSSGYNENLQIISYGSPLRGERYLPEFIRKPLFSRLANAVIDLLPNKPDIIWNFDQCRFPDQKVFGQALKLFHVVDYYPSNVEMKIANSSDVIISITDHVAGKYQHLKKPSTIVKHGVSDGLFNKHKKVDLPGSNRIKVGYSGNLYRPDFSNYKVMADIISENREVDFIFMGKNYDQMIKALQPFSNDFSNCHYVGFLDAEDLVAHLSSVDANLLVYDSTKERKLTASPHKLKEYLAVGKTVICNEMEAYEEQAALLEMTTVENLPVLFKKVMSNIDSYNEASKMEARIAYAKSQGYEFKVNEIAEFLKQNNYL